MDVTNHGDAPLSDLVFTLNHIFEVTDASVPYQRDGDDLTLHLSETLEPGRSQTIRLTYQRRSLVVRLDPISRDVHLPPAISSIRRASICRARSRGIRFRGIIWWAERSSSPTVRRRASRPTASSPSLPSLTCAIVGAARLTAALGVEPRADRRSARFLRHGDVGASAGSAQPRSTSSWRTARSR